MDEILPLLERYGYPALALIVFLEAIGLPIPAAPVLLAVGAASAKGHLSPWLTPLTALSAMLVADTILYLLGRRTGWWLLGLLCRVSLNPEACIYSSAAYFHRRGRTALLFAKFIPGINTMSPPMAGSMGMRPGVFARYDLAGASLYVLTYWGLGFLFHAAIGMVTMWVVNLGRAASLTAGAALVAFLVWRVWRAQRARFSRSVTRVQVAELAGRLNDEVTIADVRSHGYYNARAERIPGAIRIEPNRLPEILPTLQKGREVYLYCSCHNEATSHKVAEILSEAGLETKVVVGGLAAWKRAGYPLEFVPADDVVQLPRFV